MASPGPPPAGRARPPPPPHPSTPPSTPPPPPPPPPAPPPPAPAAAPPPPATSPCSGAVAIRARSEAGTAGDGAMGVPIGQREFAPQSCRGGKVDQSLHVRVIANT
ncbi:hypothetical protein [Nocardia brasiliensis]|uniref:hypothetical protein n=1 Tax=Nocardia brasiliensis TaxID=37326 RepID=UPI002458C441|nr:hypothetical protein [Nocardia brasiliensis]